MTTSISYAGDIYVSPAGDDNADGTKLHPLQSIQRALRMAREWRRQGDARATGGISIRLQADRTFILDEPLYIRPEDSGTSDSPLIITSTEGKPAIISGQAATLTTAGRPLLTRSLWRNGRKLLRAQNCPEGGMQPILDFNTTDETITIPASSLLDYGIRSIADAPQLEMTVHQRWAIALLRVRDIKIKGDKAILSFHNPESRWEFAHPWPQPVINGDRGSSSFCLTNARQFLDTSDEWWQDYSDGTIHTPAGNDSIVLPALSRLVTIEGTEMEHVSNVLFRNVTFSYSAWQRPMTAGHVTLQGGFPIIDAYKLTEHEGLPWAAGLENQAWVARPESAVSVSYADNVSFVGCQFTHLASTALDYAHHCSDIVVGGCHFSDIGGTALMCGSFAEGPTEVHHPRHYTNCERILIEGNTITDCTNEDWGAVGIACGYVRDATIKGNTVKHVNYSGICIGWGWTPQDTGMRNNVITGNTVSDYARQLYDAGGIYTMSNQPHSVIEHNTVSAPHEAAYATNLRAFPIYFDACTDGFTVRNNTLVTTPLLKEKYGYNTPGPDMKIEK